MARQPVPFPPGRERYREIFQHSGFGVLVVNTSGVVHAANYAAAALLNIPESDLVGKPLDLDAVSLEGSPLRAEDFPIAAAVARRAPVRSVPIGILRPGDRNRTWLMADAEPLFTAKGEFSEIVLSLADVTGIRQREERFRELIETLEQTAILMNADATRTLYVSPKYAQIWGRSVEDLYANPRAWFEFVYPDDRPLIEAAMARLVSGEPVKVEHRVILPDGSVRWMHQVGIPVRDAEGRVQRLLGSSRDITDRKTAEEALRAAEERLRALLEQVPAIVWTTDTELRFTSGKGTGLQRLGFRENELVGTPASALFEAEGSDFPPLGAHRRALAGEPVSFEVEWRGRIYDAQLLPLHDRSGTVSGVVGVALDITEREQAKKAAIEWKNRYDAAVQASGQVLYESNVRTGKVKYAGYPEKVLGYSVEQLEGDFARWVALIHPDDRERFVRESRRVRREKGIFHLEYRMRSGAGGYIIVLDEGNCVSDASGELAYIIGFVTNITEEKRLEEQLRQAQKMEAVDRLAGGIAHDFNNLLQVILGYGETLREQLAGNEQALGSLGEIENAARRSAALVSQLLAFSRRQMLQPRVLDLNEIIRSAERMLRPLLGEDIELRTSLAPDLGLVAADAGQLSQVIVNLAVNARDAMPEGGRLVIATSNVSLAKPEVRPDGTVPPGNYVLLSVSDTGMGIDPETRSRMFEPFFTTKGISEGTGLGLSMVQGIVMQSGGTILVDSEPGKGATLEIYLPRSEAPPAGTEEAVPAEAVRGKETILVVEDEDSVRKLVQRMLEKAGYTVLQARSGTEAIEVMREHAGAIDLIITDVVMPGMSGLVLAQKARELRRGLKVIYVSGYADESIRGAQIPRGADFLPKPFSAEKVLHTVRRVLEEAA